MIFCLIDGFFRCCRGDDATRNFGYAIQMNDNIHQVWSMFGDFLESVYTTARTRCVWAFIMLSNKPTI